MAGIEPDRRARPPRPPWDDERPRSPSWCVRMMQAGNRKHVILTLCGPEAEAKALRVMFSAGRRPQCLLTPRGGRLADMAAGPAIGQGTHRSTLRDPAGLSTLRNVSSVNGRLLLPVGQFCHVRGRSALDRLQRGMAHVGLVVNVSGRPAKRPRAPFARSQDLRIWVGPKFRAESQNGGDRTLDSVLGKLTAHHTRGTHHGHRSPAQSQP
jgi:hypothetical protein